MILLFRSCFLTLESFEKLIRKKSKSPVGVCGMPGMCGIAEECQQCRTQTKGEHFPPQSQLSHSLRSPQRESCNSSAYVYRRSPNLQRSFHSCLWLLCCTVHHPISGFLWQSTCYFFDMAPNILPFTYRLIF